MTANGMGPLALASVASHVAVKLDRAAHAALSYGALAEGYVHPITSDLTRVKRHEGLRSDAEAVEWMVVAAVEGLQPRKLLSVDGGKVALLGDATIEDLTFDGRKVWEVQNPHVRLRDPFNPMSGEFSDNIRRTTGSLDELRESMREFGWIPEFPAIKDECGVVLVGHRRLAVAAELGIEPVFSRVVCGQGDEADARRFRLAIASNIGSKPFTPQERTRIGEYLYGAREWTMVRIGQALGVSQKTISGDLAGLYPGYKPPRPKGGRPKNAPSPNRKQAPDLEAEIRDLVNTGSSIPREELVAKHGVSGTVVRRLTERERGRKEAREELAAQSKHCPTCTCHTRSP